MKTLINLIIFISLNTVSAGQSYNEIREEKEIGKEFHFENSEDGILHSLDFTFTRFVGTGLIKAKLDYITKDLRTGSSDTLSLDLFCSWVADIVDVDSTGYEYNAKVCRSQHENNEYIFEINESRTDYPSVNLTILDPKQKEPLTQIELMRKEKM